MRAGGECSGQKNSIVRRSGWKREHTPAWGPEIIAFREMSRPVEAFEFEPVDKGWLVRL